MNKKIDNLLLFDDLEFNTTIKKLQNLTNMIELETNFDKQVFNDSFYLMKNMISTNRYFQLMFINNLVNIIFLKTFIDSLFNNRIVLVN